MLSHLWWLTRGQRQMALTAYAAWAFERVPHQAVPLGQGTRKALLKHLQGVEPSRACARPRQTPRCGALARSWLNTALGSSQSFSLLLRSLVFTGVCMKWNHFPRPAKSRNKVASEGWENLTQASSLVSRSCTLMVLNQPCD